jgi:hypothetical protein
MNNFFVELSKFEKLEKLVILIEFRIEAIEDVLNPNKSRLILIGNKCGRLRIFNFENRYGRALDSNDKNLLKLFSGFYALQKLIVSQKFNQQNESIIEPLKSCRKLKYLELSLHHSNGKALEDIDLYLPYIKKIVIHFDFKFNSEIFQNLSKSKSLTKLVKNISYCSEMIGSLIINVLKIFHKIREIYFDENASK